MSFGALAAVPASPAQSPVPARSPSAASSLALAADAAAFDDSTGAAESAQSPSTTMDSPSTQPVSPVVAVGSSLAHPAGTIFGDYVEARSCSVFAGACHYNGELIIAGHEAVMAWSIASGRWHGVDLTGVKIAAALAADANLGDEHAARKSQIAIDTAATDAQAAAALDAIQSRYGAALGTIVSVRRTPITFRHEEKQYTVSAGGFVKLFVKGLPNDECCKQPNLVWYTPIVPLQGRKVGYTRDAQYIPGDITDAWQRSGENSAFYGAFSF
jgi:hypothetical protein